MLAAWARAALPLALGVAVALTAAGCGGASANSGGAGEGDTTSQTRRRHRADTEGCPTDGCFMSEGRCMTVPLGEPEEMRGDEVPVVEPVPCEARCCDTGE
jgi:hypothetical protein